MFFDGAPALELVTRSLVLGPLTLLWVVAVVRLIGLRTFSKMTAFDFVATVATGSLLATAAKAENWSSFVQSSLAILAILGLQAGLAFARRRSDKFREAIGNDPLLLFSEGRFHQSAMTDARISEADIWAKMREANVLDLSEVRAIVLETTGDISVLHGDHLADDILTGVRRPQNI